MSAPELSHEEVQRNAGGLAALPESDPERLAALAHARGCTGCARALRQGALLQQLLGRAQLPAPSPEALRRASASILAELASARPAVARPWRAPALAGAITLVAFPLLALIGAHPRAWSFLGESVVVALIAAGCAALAIGPRRKLAVPLALFASIAVLFINAAPAPFAALQGWSCSMVELVGALLPLGAVAFLALRGRDSWAQLGGTSVKLAARGAEGSALLYAGVAAAGALAGQAALGLTCPDRASFGHVAVFHVGAVLLAALLGAALSRMPVLRATAI